MCASGVLRSRSKPSDVGLRVPHTVLDYFKVTLSSRKKMHDAERDYLLRSLRKLDLFGEV